MIKRSYLIILVGAAALLFNLAPASGAWGARWSSGSAIGYGTVSGLKSVKNSGANVSSTLAHPGAQFCTKKHSGGGYGDSHHGTSCNDHDADSVGGFTTMTAPPPGSTPGLVFCQDINNPYHIERGAIVNVVANLTGAIVIPPSSIDSHGNATFSIHDQIDLATLRSQIPASLACPHSSSSYSSSSNTNTNKNGYTSKNQKGDSHYHTPPPPNWQLIDFVPQQFSVALQAADSHGHILTQAIFDCNISQSILNHLNYHESKQYTCTTRFNQ